MPNALQYINLFDQCRISPLQIGSIKAIVDNKILKNKPIYKHISGLLTGRSYAGNICFYRNFDDTSNLPLSVQQLYKKSINFNLLANSNKVPWYFIACVHYRESGCNFTRHLHNGDPLTSFTRQYPPNRPQVGHGPPFTFEESAVDALKLRGVDKVTAWPLPVLLKKLEAYNGAAPAYETHHINSPYLWAGSNLYTKGGFPRDHVYSSNYVNKQIGVAVILKEMELRGIISIPRH